MVSATLRIESHDDAAQARRLNLLMFGRLLISLLGLTAIVAFKAGWKELPFPEWPAYTVLSFACGINLIYLLLARARITKRAGLNLTDQAMIQLAMDVVLVTMLVYLTGIEQVFTFLYFATVISAAIMISGRGGLLFASMSTILLSVVSFLFRLAVNRDIDVELPFLDPDRIQEIAHSTQVYFLFPYLVSFGLSLHIVAILAGYLVREARIIRILHQDILQNLADGVMAINRHGHVEFANTASVNFLMMKPSTWLRGKPYDEVLPRGVSRLVVESLEAGRDFSRRFLLADRPVEVLVKRLLTVPKGELRGILLLINDVTLRDQLVRVSTVAERFGALLEMSASMAHEIRNPLASIRSAARELTALETSTEDDRTLLAVLVRESGRLDRIISDFLEFASDRRLEIGLCDISTVVREVGAMLTSREEARSGQIAVDVETPAGMIARADADRLKQVILNLGINAIEAVDGVGRVGLSVRRVADRIQPVEGDGQPPSEGIVIEVADTGPGIEPENLSRVFDPFFTTKPRGTGMGLAIAHKIVRAHDGQIVVENREGGGTCARIWLPV